MELVVIDKDTLADVLLHLPAFPEIVIQNGDEERSYLFADARRARDFLVWAYRKFVEKNGGRIIVRDADA